MTRERCLFCRDSMGCSKCSGSGWVNIPDTTKSEMSHEGKTRMRLYETRDTILFMGRTAVDGDSALYLGGKRISDDKLDIAFRWMKIALLNLHPFVVFSNKNPDMIVIREGQIKVVYFVPTLVSSNYSRLTIHNKVEWYSETRDVSPTLVMLSIKKPIGYL